MTIEVAPTPERTSWRSLPPLALVPIAGLAWWLIGFLPWLVDGLGSQYDLSTRLLPLFAGNVGALVLGAGLGGVLGGLTARLGTGSLAARAGASAAGVVIVLLITLLPSRGAVSGDVDSRVTGGLTVVVIVVTIVGLGIGLLGVTGRIGLGLALAAAAGATPMWFMSVVNAMGQGAGTQLDDTQRASQWLGAAVLVAALICIGVRPVARIVAWPAVVLLAWLIGPTITAASYMDVFLRSGMGLPDMWGDHLSATMDVWRMAASLHARPLTQWIVGVVVAGGIAFWLARRQPAAPGRPAQ